MRNFLVFLFITVSILPVAQARLFCHDLTEDRPFESRLQHLHDELAKVQSLQVTSPIHHPGILWVLFFSEARDAKDEYEGRLFEQERLSHKIDILKFIEPLIKEARNDFQIDIEQEALLLRRLESGLVWANALEMIFAMRWHSSSIDEENFWTGCFYYLVYGPENKFFLAPYHHWMLSVVLDARKLEESKQNTFFRSRAIQLSMYFSYYQQEPNSESRSKMSLRDYVLRLISSISDRNMTAEYHQALKSGVLTEAEKSMLSHVTDLNQSVQFF